MSRRGSFAGRAVRGLVGVALAASSVAVLAQAYPSKPIRFVAPFPAGSGIDTMSRVMLEEIRRNTGATIVVENRPGALGQIGTEYVARAPADGYTVMSSSSATHSSGPQLVKKVPYDPVRDFTHIGLLCRFDVAMVVSAAGPHRTLQALVAEGRRSPDKLTYGYGSGTAQVTSGAFVRSAAIQVRGIPYKGQPPALADLLGGQVDFVMADLAVLLPNIKAGKLVPLGVASARRSSLLPDVPTFTEQGFRDVELVGWVGISGPAGLPKEVVDWWTAEMNRALSRREFLDRLLGIAVEGETNTVEQFNRYVREQYETWGRRIRDAGIQPE